MTAHPSAITTNSASTAIGKIQLRILPFIFLLYIVAFLDRVNIGFAALTMNKELAISAEQFGLLAGIFFFGYFLFGVPSNVMLHKLGAREWIAWILVSWGIVSACTGFAQNAVQLYVVRFLLGVAESGFFPGMILYMTYWFRQRERAQAVAFFMTGLPISSIVGAPISGVILDHIHWLGVSSWRWLLVLEAAPAIVLGILTYRLLPNRPADARFLTQPEKDWLAAELAKEEKSAQASGAVSAWKALGSGRVWYLAIIYFTIIIGVYAMSFWLPQVVKGLSKLYSNTTVGFLVPIPHICGLIAMLVLSRHSDRTQERRWHAAIPAILGGVALLVVGRVTSPALSIALLALMAIGVDSFFGPFWSLPSKFLTGVAAASGIALINSVGNLGGFVGPYVIGAVSKRTGSTSGGLAFVGVSMIVSAMLVLLLKDKNAEQTP
jgi:ACS family tartrate transporter-like MFS transporter